MASLLFPDDPQQTQGGPQGLLAMPPADTAFPFASNPIGTESTRPPGPPPVGILPGKLTTNPALTDFAPDQPRPFGRGEYLENPSGSWSNEISVTIPAGAHKPLNGGRPTVVPTLWIEGGQPVRVDPATAARYAAQSGLQFPSFDSEADANAFADQREENWQAEKTPAELTRSVPSLEPTQAAKAIAMASLLFPDDQQQGPGPQGLLGVPSGDWRDTIAPQPSAADAADATAREYQAFLARDRAEQVRLGYVDPDTGERTPGGWKQQAQVIAGGLGPADVGALAGITRATTGGPAYSLQRLHPRMMTPITTPMGAGHGEHVFSIRNPANEDVGLMGTRWEPETGELHVRGIESNEGSNTLGLPAINQLRDALLELYPGVKTLTGRRISGMAPNRDATQRVTKE